MIFVMNIVLYNKKSSIKKKYNSLFSKGCIREYFFFITAVLMKGIISSYKHRKCLKDVKVEKTKHFFLEILIFDSQIITHL